MRVLLLRVGPASLALAAFALGIQGPGGVHSEPGFVPATQEDGGSDGSVTSSMNVIANTFRESNPAHLRPLMPSGGKVFLALHSLGEEAGYYGSDQIYFIFQRIFRARGTLEFHIGIHGEAPRKKGQAFCIGTWSYRSKDGESQSCQIFFVLAEKDRQWSLVQIREAV